MKKQLPERQMNNQEFQECVASKQILDQHFDEVGWTALRYVDQVCIDEDFLNQSLNITQHFSTKDCRGVAHLSWPRFESGQDEAFDIWSDYVRRLKLHRFGPEYHTMPDVLAPISLWPWDPYMPPVPCPARNVHAIRHEFRRHADGHLSYLTCPRWYTHNWMRQSTLTKAKKLTEYQFPSRYLSLIRDRANQPVKREEVGRKEWQGYNYCFHRETHECAKCCDQHVDQEMFVTRSTSSDVEKTKATEYKIF